jgi:hypothetical protein
MATNLIEKPISFSEYRNRRESAFKTLKAIWDKAFREREEVSTETSETLGFGFHRKHDLLSAVFVSTGYLSLEEAFASRGVDWGCFADEQQVNQAIAQLSEVSMSTEAVRLDEGSIKEEIQKLTLEGKISAVDIGIYDMSNEGQKNTINMGKKLLGPDGVLFLLVTDNRLSMLQKDKNPIRTLERRVADMSAVRGVDRISSLTLPENVTSLEEAIQCFAKTLREMEPLIRIIGNPINVGENWWQIYERQCMESNILMVYNDSPDHVSTSDDIARIRQS